MRRLPALTALAAVAVAVAVGASAGAVAFAQDGRLDRSGTRLLAERAGDRVCLTLAERDGLRLRRCLLAARAGLIRTSYADGQCSFGTRLFGIAPRGTIKVNVGLPDGDGGSKTVSLPLLRIPTRLHPAGGLAFVVRRSLAGTSGVTLTAYRSDGRRLARRTLQTFPIAGCAPPPAKPQPAP